MVKKINYLKIVIGSIFEFIIGIIGLLFIILVYSSLIRLINDNKIILNNIKFIDFVFFKIHITNMIINFYVIKILTILSYICLTYEWIKRTNRMDKIIDDIR